MSNKKSKTKNKVRYSRDYKFENRVERAFDLLRKTNVSSYDNIIKYSHSLNKNLSKSRFDILVKLKYIKNIKVINKRTKEVSIGYQLTERGKTYINDHMDGKIYASRSTFHDLKQSDYLFNNFTVSEIETYKHEKELTAAKNTDVHISLQQKMSRPDGQIQLCTGETVFIETITKDYSASKIKEKMTYSTVHNTRCIYNIL